MKHKLSKKIAVAFAAAFLMAPVTTGTVELNSQYLPVVKAAKGDHGVDWSKYQGTNGVWGYNNDKFSISQIGGTTTGWNLYDQWTYPTQVASTIAQGKRAHTYIWWQNVTTQSQADYVLNYFLPKVQTPKGSIVALDVESGYQNTAVLDYALTRIKNAGYTPVLYGYKNYLMNNTNLYYLAGKYQLWLAEYPNYAVTPYPNYNYFPSFNNVGIFQFTSTYIAGGLDGDIDLTGITDNGYKNGNPQKPQTTTPAVNAGKQIHQDTHTYVVRSGDSWWAIANRYHMSMYALAQLNGCTIQTVIHPGQVLRVADSGQGAKVSNKVQQPIAQPNQSTWRDNLGDTWHSEKGTFTLNSWVNLRWGARTSSSLIATLRPGSQVKYDAWSYHNGYTWIRQPRANGYAYMAVRNSSGPFGSFSN
ncbi:endolysin [Limosilactobacillus frumenti DSM 13145]|uniref:Endolysin n=1 Tax=Limosilactobacillus frumenti DSM 13145 TaxID=1423746 RepID=A0A0R1PF23_9LACO|nr:endolysin [Limosilactobacillus frumenti DSM 13145]